MLRPASVPYGLGVMMSAAPSVQVVAETRESQYRDIVIKRMEGREDADFARAYWDAQFPALLVDRGYAAQALNPPRNKIERLISTREIDTVLRHPLNLDLIRIIDGLEAMETRDAS